MKTAEEWVQATDKLLPCHGPIREARIKFYQQIQLDAMKEGARRAAKLNVALANDYNDYLQSDVPIECNAKDFNHKFELHQQAILTTAEQWTEKDL